MRERGVILIFSLKLFMMLYFFKGGETPGTFLPLLFFFTTLLFTSDSQNIFYTFGEGEERLVARGGGTQPPHHTPPSPSHPFIYLLVFELLFNLISMPLSRRPVLGPAAL